MIKLEELLSAPLLSEMIDKGYVVKRYHRDYPLAILNYTDKAQFDNEWNPVTRQCRGLIYNIETGDIIARPFPKFFNYGQPGADEIFPDEEAYVTDKMDGCFLRNTPLNLWDGGTVTIGEVVRDRLEVTLVGRDESGNLVPTKVLDWHNNGTKNNWLAVTVDAMPSLRSGVGRHANTLRVTSNHEVFANGEFVLAGELKVGDTMVGQEVSLSPEILHLVRSSLLGDGCVTRSGKHARWQEGHKVGHSGYVNEMREALGDAGVHRSATTSGHGSEIAWAGTCEAAVLDEIRDEWYGPDGKRLPIDLSWVDDFSVAKWYMDDGSIQNFERQAPRAVFSTHAFTEAEVGRLGELLAGRYGVSFHTNVTDKGVSLVVNSGRKGEIRTLWERIAPHVHPDLRYKLPEQYRGAEYIPMSRGRRTLEPKPVKVLSVEPIEPTKANFPSGRVGFDITTETGNYMAKGVIVHNSLGITYRTPDGVLAIATRGSFHSEQAEWATKWLHENVSPDKIERLARWSKTYTDLFEIIYPENRIVVDYGSRAELVYLASVHVYCGGAERFSDIMPVPSTPVLAGSLEGALDLEPRENAEGVVVMTADGRAVKLKQEDYLLKHRARFNLTPRRLWEAIAADVTLQDFLDGMPDEFHKDITDAWVRIEDKGLGYASDCRFLARRVAPLASRKEQAQALNDMYPELASGVFAVLDSDMRKLHRAAVRYMEPKGPEASRLIA